MHPCEGSNIVTDQNFCEVLPCYGLLRLGRETPYDTDRLIHVTGARLLEIAKGLLRVAIAPLPVFHGTGTFLSPYHLYPAMKVAVVGSGVSGLAATWVSPP